MSSRPSGSLISLHILILGCVSCKPSTLLASCLHPYGPYSAYFSHSTQSRPQKWENLILSLIQTFQRLPIGHRMKYQHLTTAYKAPHDLGRFSCLPSSCTSCTKLQRCGPLFLERAMLFFISRLCTCCLC